ncbi:hypothetical protein K491DRAFT_221063 [Lophiostoma macrostomum CBS 122681]|uniref:Uncharacterized protein n=1 Tax=Lophiostoma macrostomum CBS 122681 TaxID=1314788 RepID=A0A6A6SPR2_9PLEO|nr:hypothetical protein K491DRAFT_221063 [Lophiostoma macrostomum CBS 122681]
MLAEIASVANSCYRAAYAKRKEVDDSSTPLEPLDPVGKGPDKAGRYLEKAVVTHTYLSRSGQSADGSLKKSSSMRTPSAPRYRHYRKAALCDQYLRHQNMPCNR